MGLKDSVFDSKHFWRSDIFWFVAKWRSYGAIDVNWRRFSDCNISVVCSPTQKIHKTKVAQHGKVNFLVGFWQWCDHRFQFGRDCASLNKVWQSLSDSIFHSGQLLLNDFFGLTIHSILDEFMRNQSKVIFGLCVVTLVNKFLILAQSDHQFKIWQNCAKLNEKCHFWIQRSHISPWIFDFNSIRLPVQNLTEMDENGPKRNEILTMAQMTQFDPQSSKITSVLRSDENSTFAHFWPSHEKSWKNLNRSIQESNWPL